ncbi:uncharacterized protein MYCGRDRAFT_97913 [Zymoseptoria tritici IPO323]|uniref:Uncharacterized protein n=1 Tax=Zymoseptoria tritici (strain CBS 115943 / IPO323) TaxID=336722 RepID=F9XRR8_ZYMTI|nr:uncharacterized protein MYCGRDRAFT_97913 [Zymoseptoria tritici IPO323]EGP82051.1 hypothetical protein MYCGRDRAFT_97913 [Zymoseptoria tritici IPO323]
MPVALDAYGQPPYNVYGYQQPSQTDDARRVKERLDWEADKRRDEELRLLAEERRCWDESRLYAARSEGYGQFHMPSANPQPHQPQPQPHQPDIFLQTRQTLADQKTRLQAQTVQNEEVDIKDTLAELMKKITRTKSKLGDLNVSSRKRGAEDDGRNQTSSSRKPSESRGRSGRPTNRENFDASTWGRGTQSERASLKET